MGKINNFPQAGVENLEPQFVSNTITNLRELYDKGKPQTDEEVERRIDEYFEFCQRTQTRPGIEGLSLALCVSRITVFNWGNGTYCSERRQEIINRAKGFISAFLEQSALQGKISPPTAIFLMKNWMNYKDNLGLELCAESNNQSFTPVSLERQIEQSGLVWDAEAQEFIPEE